jgi:hypothetical protein
MHYACDGRFDESLGIQKADEYRNQRRPGHDRTASVSNSFGTRVLEARVSASVTSAFRSPGDVLKSPHASETGFNAINMLIMSRKITRFVNTPFFFCHFSNR